MGKGAGFRGEEVSPDLPEVVVGQVRTSIQHLWLHP